MGTPQAGGAPASGTDMLMQFMPLILMFVIFWFLLIRPQQKRQKEIRKFREGLKKGDNIITAGGIHGKIKEIKEDSFLISVSDNTVLRIDKGSVYPSASDAQEQEANKTKA